MLERWFQAPAVQHLFAAAGMPPPTATAEAAAHAAAADFTAEVLAMAHAGVALLGPDGDAKRRRIVCAALDIDAAEEVAVEGMPLAATHPCTTAFCVVHEALMDASSCATASPPSSAW